MKDGGFTESFWMKTTHIPYSNVLQNDLETDVCIIGSGIAGLTCAYTLAKHGKNVVVLDDGPIAFGETSRTTAHLTFILDDRFYELKSLFGLEKTRLALESHKRSVDYIEKIVKEEGIECHFNRVNGYLFSPTKDQEILEKEHDTLKEMGNAAFRWAEKAPFDDYDTGRCLQFFNQAEFYPLKYLKGVLEAILKNGGQVYTDTHASEIEEGQVVTSKQHKIKCKSIIVATNSPVNDRFYIQTKQAAYRTYVIGAQVPRGSIERALYWDTTDPYHYIRVADAQTEDKEILIIGGEDHRTGQNPDNDKIFKKLEKWSADHFPVEKVLYRWSGQIIETMDGLAFCGRNPGNKNIYIHTGDSGNGLTHGTIAGMLIPDLILGKENPWRDLYDPSRKNIRAIKEYAKENANTAYQYTDWILPSEAKSVDKIKPGEGAIVDKKAVYKDEKGQIHCLSAVCPHLGGMVHWNKVEKTWDCPCHGSRFKPDGTVVNGPANSNLKP